MMPDMSDLYAGLSGCTLVPNRFDLGEGATVSQTYAHFMAPFLMAFARPAPGKHHPGPWKAASGGLAIDISAELHLPLGLSAGHLDRLNTVWWIVALLRLRSATSLFVPVLSNEDFSSIPHLDRDPELMPMEISTSRLRIDANQRLDVGDLQWVKLHWGSSADLLENDDFNFALQAVDSCIWRSSADLALVEVWGALERLFSHSRQELSFRVSANIASFLEQPGKERHFRFRTVKGLYDQRSRAAHGEGRDSAVALQDTLRIARAALLKVVEQHRVPTSGELEAELFRDFGVGSDSQLPQ